MKAFRSVLFIALLVVLYGCGGSPPTEFLDLSASRLEKDDAVEIDGIPNDVAWQEALSVPFEEKSQAKFLWSEKQLVGLISTTQAFSSLDDAICISVQVRKKSIHVYFGRTVGQLGLVRAELLDFSLGKRLPIPNDRIAASATEDVFKRGSCHRFEFAMPWDLLGARPGQKEEIRIGAYRISPIPAPVAARLPVRDKGRE